MNKLFGVVLMVLATMAMANSAFAQSDAGAKAVGKSSAQAAPPVNDVRDFMRKKLVDSQKVLEGLTMDDLEMVAKHSQELSLLSQEATWKVLQTEEYLQYSMEFRRATNSLTEAAKKRNSDGAALAYMDVTMKCISCHKYVRGVRAASK